MPEITYTKEFVAQKLQENSGRNHWMLRGIVAIYNKQTAVEQATEATREDNGVGFNATDANILSSFAKQIIQWNDNPVQRDRFAFPLSPRQLEIAYRKMLKYAGQLAKIANNAI